MMIDTMMIENMIEAMELAHLFAFIFMIALCLALYFLPAIVAGVRKHESAVAIFALNLLLGWTGIGWIVALVWALTNPSKTVMSSPPSPSSKDVIQKFPNLQKQGSSTVSAADEIQKLGDLRERGLLTDEEFNKIKQRILE